ncbi:Erythrocyte band 7 integral membrane protein [Schistosoma japonicum]|uniref:Erythrocyte band 7 integral membrane protein n=1 Tax=Schistosoma japonicum TaxID=6182 RepID=A0A4Z2CLA2_SCHJA|nr:Erythrocyte band 7 integral membrane protein [Schistosoma japonicum]
MESRELSNVEIVPFDNQIKNLVNNVGNQKRRMGVGGYKHMKKQLFYVSGRVKRSGKNYVIGAGLQFVMPCADRIIRIDLRTKTVNIPPQEVLTSDAVTVSVDAVVFMRVIEPAAALLRVENSLKSAELLAVTTLRSVLGTYELSQLLTSRDQIDSKLKELLDDATSQWGIKIERVEIKDVSLPQDMQRAMAAQAQADRASKAKVIAAQGELEASSALTKAAIEMDKSPAALQLRYLQTLTTIAAEQNSTIIFPIPIELFKSLISKKLSNILHLNTISLLKFVCFYALLLFRFPTFHFTTYTMFTLNYLICMLHIITCSNDFNNIDGKFNSYYLRPDEPDLHMLDDYQGHEHYDDFGQHYSEYDHDLITGSHEYSQKFKELEPEEAKLQLGKLFHKIDVDNNAKIDKEELKNWIIQSFISLDLEASKPRFKEYDADGDGQLAWSEYTNKIYGYTEQELEDLRKDGKNETSLFMQSIDEEKFRFDSNFKNYDINADGKLDHDEMALWITPGFNRTATDEMEHLFNETDKDKDGLLTKEEVIDQHDLWVGSQATDYGRHLENLPRDEL